MGYEDIWRSTGTKWRWTVVKGGVIEALARTCGCEIELVPTVRFMACPEHLHNWDIIQGEWEHIRDNLTQT